MRLLYVLLTCLLLPLVVAVEAWKGRGDPGQRGRVRQRLGFGAPQPGTGSIWIHAVSVGEVQAATAVVRELQRRHPDADFVITTATATGAQRVRTLFGDSVRHCYLPYDAPGPVRRFLDRTRPRIAVILETEIWPTLYCALGRRRVPIVMASARVTEKSVGRYRRLAGLFRATLARDIRIGAQTDSDAARFREIGAPAAHVQVTGNVKYDQRVPDAAVAAGQAFRSACGLQRPVWIAGSTHDGEEAAALDAHQRIRARHPSALLILVPRHPQRFDAVRALLARRGCAYVERSSGATPGPQHEVFLVDTVGELQAFYAASDVAFVAGSLVPIGGHNLLEPAVLGLPVLSGPHTGNAPDIAELLRAAGGLRIVNDADELSRVVMELFADPARAAATGALARAAVEANRGAVERTVALVEPLLSPQAWSAAAATAAESAGSGNR